MEDTKSVTETLDFVRSGRKASLMGRSRFVKTYGPLMNENPGTSSSIAGCDPQPSKGQGFASNVDHLAVSRS